MEEVKVLLGERSYSICIGSGILEELGKRVGEFGFSPQVAIVSNPTVFSIYGKTVRESLEREGFDVYEVIIPDGEEHKNLTWVSNILTELLKRRLDRKSAVIALGGGVVGDIACFASSIYMRGIACIQVPTTLLSQVDSSVGGKTGVNHELGKNMIGTFYQPSLVWIDVETLNTLPRREILAGMSEIIKYGVIRDSELFDYLTNNREEILLLQRDKLAHIIKRSCEIKAEVVSEDEREAGIRAILNFGHTIGHAIETLTGYVRYLHGEAVSIGMCYEAELSRIMGRTNQETVEQILDIIKKYELPYTLPDGIDHNSITNAMRIDKKVIGGKLRVILPRKVGSVMIEEDVIQAHVLEALQCNP